MTYKQQAIQEEIKSYILQSVHAEKEKIQNETLVFKEGYFDSMGFITLISFLEEKYNIRTGDEDLIEENFESINAITDFVSRKLNKS